jgi:hypothetical protein
MYTELFVTRACGANALPDADLLPAKTQSNFKRSNS